MALATLCANEPSSSQEFADLDSMDFLRVGATTDKLHRPVIMIIARNFHPHAVPHDRLRRYILDRCDAVVEGPYSLVWIHTRATYWANCPSIWWLWRTYESLPPKYRSNLSDVFILHCDMSLWTASSLILPWLSGRMWHKVTWISRIEFLWDYVKKTSVPAFVSEHDSILEEQPLSDYGIVATKEMASAAGLPAPL